MVFIKKTVMVTAVLVLICVNAFGAEGRKTKEVVETDSIAVCSLGAANLEDFLNNPQYEALLPCFTWEYVELSNGKYFCRDGDKIIFKATESELEVFGNYEVNKDFFDFVDIDNLNQILRENGVNGKVNKRVIIDMLTLSICLFTDEGVYVITSGAFVDNYYNPGYEEGYHFYTIPEYNDIYGVHEAKIVFNGEVKDTDYKPIFVYKEIKIPIRMVLECISDNVEWNEKSRCVSFEAEGDKYAMYIGKQLQATTFINGEETMDKNWMLLGGKFIYKGYIYVQEFVAVGILKHFGISCDVDYDTKTVNLSHIAS